MDHHIPSSANITVEHHRIMTRNIIILMIMVDLCYQRKGLFKFGLAVDVKEQLTKILVADLFLAELKWCRMYQIFTNHRISIDCLLGLLIVSKSKLMVNKSKFVRIQNYWLFIIYIIKWIRNFKLNNFSIWNKNYIKTHRMKLRKNQYEI